MYILLISKAAFLENGPHHGHEFKLFPAKHLNFQILCFLTFFDIKMFLDNSNIDGGKIQIMETESSRNIQFFLEKMRSTVLTYIFRTLLVLANCVTDLKEEEQ